MGKETLKTGELDATMVISDTMSSNRLPTEGEESELFDENPRFASRFPFICKFAAGGVGVVYKARDMVFNRIVAVKTLNDQFKDDEEANQAFLNESRLNATLDHPSIVPVYALGHTEDGRLQCVMKLINGTSLDRFIDEIRERYDQRKITPVQEHHALISRLEYFLKICEAVEYCHSMKIVHGDIKPANIQMGRFGEVYLMDWGCARHFGAKPERISGTPNYLPPEFLADKTVTPQIDIFALGMILFEMTTLLRASQTEEDRTTRGCLIYNPETYSHYLPSLKINDRILAIILKAVNPDPARRYQTVAELAGDVRHFIYDEEISAAPDHLLRKLFRILYRNRMKTVLVAGAVFLLFCLGLFYLSYSASRAEQLHAEEAARRVTMTAYTDLLANSVERRFLLSQAQLLLFADNLIEDTLEQNSRKTRFYDQEDYRKPETSPPGMIRSDLYPNPVNLRYMVRTPSEKEDVRMQKLNDPKAFVYLCNKILYYDLSSHDVQENRRIQQKLLSPENMIQRFFVRWADGTRYAYPGSYDPPGTEVAREVWEKDLDINRKISWSTPYRGLAGQCRIAAKYPMFAAHDRYLGHAGIELRLTTLLQPLLQATLDDPVHELYIVTRQGTLLQIINGKLALIQGDDALPDGISSGRIRQLLDHLKRSKLKLITAELGGRSYYVSSAAIPTMEGDLLQLISAEKMKNHSHALPF